MKSVTVASFNSLAEAEPLRRHLILAGIEAEAAADSRLEPSIDFARPGAGVQIRVRRADFARALALVAAWNSGGANPPGGVVAPPDLPASGQRAVPSS